MKAILIVLLVASSSGFAQNEKTGTIKVKKPGSEGITVLELVQILSVPSSIEDQMPAFPGGEEMMNAFILKNIKYPEAERKAGKQGMVSVSFVVKSDGSVSNIKVIKGVAGGPGINKEALRVVGMMPKWTPGRQNLSGSAGVPYELRIKFQL